MSPRSGPHAGAGLGLPRRPFSSEHVPRIPVAAAYGALAVLALAARPDPAATRGVAAPPAVMQAAPESLSLELMLPPRVRAGKPVTITLRVRNQTERTLDLYLRGRTITFDVVVARPGGEVVWRRLENEIIPAIVHLRTLAPAERLEVETVWDQRTKQGRRVEPGEYTARGLLLVEGDPLETPLAPFRIVEP